MGDAARDRLSDRGSIPLRSIEKAQCLLGFFVFVLHIIKIFVQNNCISSDVYVKSFLLQVGEVFTFDK